MNPMIFLTLAVVLGGALTFGVGVLMYSKYIGGKILPKYSKETNVTKTHSRTITIIKYLVTYVLAMVQAMYSKYIGGKILPKYSKETNVTKTHSRTITIIKYLVTYVLAMVQAFSVLLVFNPFGIPMVFTITIIFIVVLNTIIFIAQDVILGKKHWVLLAFDSVTLIIQYVLLITFIYYLFFFSFMGLM